MEIVTAPDFHSAEEARSFVRDFRNLLVTLGVCNGKMSGKVFFLIKVYFP